MSAHRKAKKSLSAKQRTAKKAGRAFAEEDAAQLRHVSEQQGAVQKQLEQVYARMQNLRVNLRVHSLQLFLQTWRWPEGATRAPLTHLCVCVCRSGSSRRTTQS